MLLIHLIFRRIFLFPVVLIAYFRVDLHYLIMALTSFILIDDDAVSNTISSLTIEHILNKESDIKTFTNPETGFDYIIEHPKNRNGSQTILLLDLNMPIMSGWEFLEKFDNLSKD